MRKKWNRNNIETTKQEPGSKDCLACVAAMITQTTPEEFKEYCTQKGLCLWDDLSLFRYIRLYGWTPALTYDNFIARPNTLFDILSGPCYLVVESDYKALRDAGATHAVLWDGKRVHDPLPAVMSRALRDYKIQWLIPLSQNIDEIDCECGCHSVNKRHARDM